MPRSRVKTTFQRARPQSRQKASDEPTEGVYDLGDSVLYMRKPNGQLSPLGSYIEDNRESGLPIHELVEQFQEYDHPTQCNESRLVAQARDSRWYVCDGCGLIVKRSR